MKSSIAAAFLASIVLSGCRTHEQSGDLTASAPNTMIQYGCPACHVISGVPGAVGKVGPSLNNIDQRSILGGTLENSPDNLVRWIQHPQKFHPGTAMPEMGVTSQDAKRIAAFLSSRQ